MQNINTSFRQPSTHSINDVLTWDKNKELILKPIYQRYRVWNENAKSFLIDSIFKDFPMPAIFIREKLRLNEQKTEREVLDGQQRLSTIIDYYNDKFTVKMSHNKDIGGIPFSQLDDDKKTIFLNYKLSIEKINLYDDATIFEIFARLNSNNIPLNEQEKRNALYTGEFKTTCYELALLTRDLFIKYNTFTNRKISRMADVEFISILLMEYELGYITNGSKIINKYYKDNDLIYRKKEYAEACFKKAVYYISNLFSLERFDKFIFTSAPYFYDLFKVISHFIGQNVDIKENINKIFSALLEVDYELSNQTDKEDDEGYSFYNYQKDHIIHSTDRKVKERRVNFLIDYISKKL